MNGKLSELTMFQGYKNMKELSKASHVPYTTLLHYDKVPSSSWQKDNFDRLSNVLKMSNSSLVRELEHPIKLPFIKWVGGKRQLLPELIKHVPKNYDNYIEPFIGGGALLFKLSPKSAIINDSNFELINTWRALKNHPNKLIRLLKYYENHDSKEKYLEVRSVDRTGEIENMTSVERAARFIYLNKGGFNGLWRVNQAGQNNVPYGGHKLLNLTPGFLLFDSQYLKNANITMMNGDYKRTLRKAKKGDFVYLDPPYIPLTPTSSFTSYTKNGFGLIQQKELANRATLLAQSGVKVMLSNADVPLIQKLYSKDIFTIHHVQARRAINSNGNKRGAVGEVVITSNNY